jgi:hypothetical protein
VATGTVRKKDHRDYRTEGDPAGVEKDCGGKEQTASSQRDSFRCDLHPHKQVWHANDAYRGYQHRCDANDEQ